MKTNIFKIMICLSFTLLCGFAFAGGDWDPTWTSNTWQAISRTGNVSTTGNIGVGMTNPTYKLDVNGSFHIANGYQAIFSKTSSASSPAITFADNLGTGFFNPGSAQIIGFATNGTERMRIDQAGVVGIATLYPTSGFKLDINGLMLVRNGYQAIFSATSNASNPSMSFFNDNNTGIFRPNEDVVAISTGSQERMRIDANGRLTLNNIPAQTNPATTFLVSNNGMVSSRTAAQVLSDIGAGGGLPHGVTPSYVPFANDSTTWATSPISVNEEQVAIGGSSKLGAAFTVNSSLGRLSIAAVGPVAILNSSESVIAGLTVDSSLSSHNAPAATFIGDVIISSGSLKINDWTIEAPDYVFEKDYNLPNLKTVEDHITTKKHLPGVPSAAEMKENGVDLSQMNMILLKKVEELTLYVIDQNKQIMEQNKKIEELEKKISEK